MNTTDEVLIATGKNYADSLSASATGLPMLLVDKNLTDSQKAFLQNTSRKFVILGGTGQSALRWKLSWMPSAM